MVTLLPSELQRVERRVRLIGILLFGRKAGITPMSTDVIHSIAYLADVLSPVWHLPILDAQLVKQVRKPYFPALERDLDQLVGIGLVEVERFRYVNPAEQIAQWRIDADYRLIEERAKPILDSVAQFDQQSRKFDFVREVVYAASGLGPEGIAEIGLVDAAYSDPLVDVGGLLDVDRANGGKNLTATVAERFAALTEADARFDDAELVHLYVRHLYTRMNVA